MKHFKQMNDEEMEAIDEEMVRKSNEEWDNEHPDGDLLVTDMDGI